MENGNGTTTHKVNEARKNTLTVKQTIKYCAEHITTVTHVLIIWFVYYIWYITIKNVGWDLDTTSLHAVLYVTGWMLLMLEGIMQISPDNVFSRYMSHDNRARVHTVLQIMSFAFCVSGYFVIFVRRDSHNRSVHAKTGFSSLVLTIPSILNGFTALFAVRLKRFIKPGTHKLIHSVFGMSTFVVGTVSLYYGIEKAWYTRKVSEDMVLFSKGVVLFCLTWSMLKPLMSNIGRLKYVF